MSPARLASPSSPVSSTSIASLVSLVSLVSSVSLLGSFRWLGVMGLLGLLGLSSCSAPRLAEPKLGPQIDAAFGPEIDSSPPTPVPVSEIWEKEKLASGMVWIDGEYVFNGGRWEWLAGAWCMPPKGASYFARAQGRRIRRPSGQRFVRWSDAQSRYEEVELGKDVWRWAKGAWYSPAQGGGFAPMKEGRGECQEPKRDE